MTERQLADPVEVTAASPLADGSPDEACLFCGARNWKQSKDPADPHEFCGHCWVRRDAVSTAKHSFACGHIGEEPPRMGRGKARQRRLDRHYGRPCYPCRVQAIRERAQTLTHVNGTPYSPAEIQAYVESHLPM